MVYGSVCSGIEAASVAWHTLGWTPAWFCEIEPFPSAVLKERYPHVQNYGDFTRLSEPDHPVRSTPIDVLVGGTPCQAFSVAGLREGMRDPRGGLTLEYVRLARALRPKWLVWENVPGVLSSGQGRDFGAFVGALVESGYGVAWRVLDAQHVRVDGYPHAVPQRRKRVFLVGHLGGDAARAAAVLFEPEGVRRDSAPRRASRKGVAADAARGSAERQWPSDVACTLAACFGEKLGLEDQHALGGASLFVPASPIVMSDGQSNASIHADGISPSLTCVHEAPIAAIPYDLFQVTAPINRQNRDEHSPCHTLARDNAAHAAVVTATPAYDPCPTLTSRMQGSTGWAPYNEDAHLVSHAAVVQPIAFTFDDGQSENPKATHQFSLEHSSPLIKARPLCTGGTTMSVRRLTPTECERLQGFPDGWTQVAWKGKAASECPDGPRYKALGNSMAVNCMRWIGARIQAVEEA